MSVRSLPEIDLDFRPKTYWTPASEQPSRAKATYNPGNVKPAVLKKTFFGCRPQLRSGADIPDFFETELEIARLRFAKTVHEEVTSLRARRVGSRIVYRVVDELVEEWGGEIKVHPRSSQDPLSLRQLIGLIDSAEIPDEHRIGLVIPSWELDLTTVRSDIHQLRDSLAISSVFYPQLPIYYDRLFLEWANRGGLFAAATKQ